MLKWFSILALIVFSACKPAVDEQNGGFTYTKPENVPLAGTTGTSITLISPATSPNYNSTITLRIHGVVAGETVKLYNDTNCLSLKSSAVAAATTADITVTGLPVGTTSFSTRSTNSTGSGPCSGLKLSYNYLGAAPSNSATLTLVSPASSPEYDNTPTFEATGLVPGEILKLYKNSTCTQLVGSTVVTAGTMQITSAVLAPATYTFATIVTNSAGTSSCSTATATYQYLGAGASAPSSMTLSSPDRTPNYVSTPTYVIGGVNAGDVVKVYTDAGCTAQVGSATASTSTVSISLAALGVGTHNFYAKASNSVDTSGCSGLLASYEYLGASPTVQVTWNANKETAVNMAGGGYRVYYSRTIGFNTATATYVDVPYVAGPTAPTSANITGLLAGTIYFRVVAYSARNPVGGSTGSVSNPSNQFSVTLP